MSRGFTDPNKKPVYEVIYEGQVWNPNHAKDEVYRIWGVEDICNFLDQFPLAQEVFTSVSSTDGDDTIVIQVGAEAFVTINRLPLFELSNLESLKSVLKARNILKAA